MRSRDTGEDESRSKLGTDANKADGKGSFRREVEREAVKDSTHEEISSLSLRAMERFLKWRAGADRSTSTWKEKRDRPSSDQLQSRRCISQPPYYLSVSGNVFEQRDIISRRGESEREERTNENEKSKRWNEKKSKGSPLLLTVLEMRANQLRACRNEAMGAKETKQE